MGWSRRRCYCRSSNSGLPSLLCPVLLQRFPVVGVEIKNGDEATVQIAVLGLGYVARVTAAGMA
jgi:hypothetical protein